MSRVSDLQRVLDSVIVAVIRADNGDLLVDVAEALLAGGVEVMEVTFTVPKAIRVLERVADRVGDRILLGAGTVLDSETARAAILAGAEFIVSPSTNLDVIRLCRRYDKLVMPGALTPTEVVTAWETGADIVKIFPSDFLWPSIFVSSASSFTASTHDANRRSQFGNRHRVFEAWCLCLGSWWRVGRVESGRSRRHEAD